MCTACLANGDWNSVFHIGPEFGNGTEVPNEAGGTSQGSSGSANVDGVISGSRWDSLSLTYSFPILGTFYGSGYADPAYSNGFARLTPTMITAARASFTLISSYSNMAFTEESGSTSSSSVDIMLGQSDTPSTAYAYYPGNSVLAGDIWFGRQYNYTSPAIGNYAYFTMLHELGHSMGLKHGHESDGIAGAVSADRDSSEFTLMTYRSSIGGSTSAATSETYGFAQTYMMLDTAALQSMYGADYTNNSGSNTYTFNTTTGEMAIDGVGQGTPGGNRIFRTVWDGGGTDTYDFSNYTQNQSINLAAGGWSLFSDAQLANLGGNTFSRANVFNALLFSNNIASLIENAVGGSGNDRMNGNEISNTLTGNAGADTLVGQGGEDILSGGNGIDILHGDFDPNGPFPPGPPTPPPISYGSGYTALAASATNNGAGSALNLSSNFSFSADIYIENSTTQAHTTVNAIGNGFAGWYTLALNVGNRLTVDIDFTTLSYDSFVRIVSANGVTELGSNDDNGNDPGSSRNLDSGLTYIAATSGTFYVVVGTYGAINTVAQSVSYRLNVSVAAGGTTTSEDPLRPVGNAGADILDGGAGADSMFGGDGSDVYYVDDSADSTTEVNAVVASGGFDTVYASQNFTLSANVEQLVMTGSASVGTGNSIDNSLNATLLFTGASLFGLAGNDAFYGSNYADSIDGGADNDVLLAYYSVNGADTLVGGSGDDVYFLFEEGDVVTELLNGGLDTYYTQANVTLAANVEQAVIYGVATTVTGNASNNNLFANNSSYALTLDGGAGNDWMIGSSLSDTILGGANNDILQGLAGTNQMSGGTGDDQYFSTSATDVITEAASEGRDTVYASYNVTTLAANVEQLLSYGGATIGNGNGLDNTLYGNNNTVAMSLDGGAGADLIFGSNFADTIIGGTGSDIMVGGTGNDQFSYTISGNMGADLIIDFTDGSDFIAIAGLGYDMTLTNITITASGADTLITFAGGNLQGTTLTLAGVSAVNVTVADFVV